MIFEKAHKNIKDIKKQQIIIKIQCNCIGLVYFKCMQYVYQWIKWKCIPSKRERE